VAEGVEEAEHAEFLVANGCRIAQGFHFSRPVPGPEVTALLEASIASDRRR
jgi:EAL domain-containing protein (putative c-di-GMP-specific phosphodiesterase class I)